MTKSVSPAVQIQYGCRAHSNQWRTENFNAFDRARASTGGVLVDPVYVTMILIGCWGFHFDIYRKYILFLFYFVKEWLATVKGGLQEL